MMMLNQCCCGCAPTPTPVRRFTNVTTVNGGASPYMRPDSECTGGGACVASTCGGTGEPVCYHSNYDNTPYIPSEGLKGIDSCTGGALVSAVLNNCYSHDGTTMHSIDSHCGQGWKGVASAKLWQGQWGMVESGPVCCNDGGLSQKKYRSQSVNISGTVRRRIDSTDHCGDPPDPDTFEEYNYTHSLQQTSTIDTNGNISRSGNVHMQSTFAQTSGSDSYLDSCLVSDCTGAGTAGAGGGAGISELVWPNGAPWVPKEDWDISATCGIITFKGADEVTNVSGTVSEVNALQIGLAPSATSWVGGDGRTYTLTVESNQPLTFTLADNKLKAVMSVGLSVAGARRDCEDFPDDRNTLNQLSITYSYELTLAGDYDYSSVIGEANGMLGEWDLTDDLRYPWRQDGECWLLPFVSKDEGGGTPTLAWPDGCDEFARSTTPGIVADCTSCTFLQENNYTGDLRGSPLPSGYGFHFNHFHRVVEVCCSGGIPGLCESGLGELAASPLPMTATQWTTADTGWNMRGPGAHVSQYAGFSGAPGEYVVVQKWAETLQSWPRENLARPAARDRYLFDETDVACGTLAEPDLFLTSAPSTPFSAGEKVAIGSGVYSITGGSGLAYTVSSILYDTPISCDGASRLRYPSARAIMSTLPATCVQSSPGVVTVTTTTKHRLKGGGSESDTVTFTGVGGLTSAVATVTSEYEFTVSGTLTTSPTSGTISDGGSGYASLDSTCSTHSVLYRTFQSNYRGAAENGDPSLDVVETMLLIPPSSRHPTVLCISPNGESFPYGVTYSMGSVEADMCYGADWSANFLQAVPSTYWQAPHAPCDWASAWTQAELPCQTLAAGEYAFPPLVEPLLAAPWTADDDGLFFAGVGYPGAVGRATCATLPYGSSHPPQWYPAWLTCTDWQELIGFRC